MPATIRRATLDDLDALVPLFDGYRMFYSQPSDPALARDFLQQRLQRGESVVLLAERGDTAAGFTQLYPMFSSVRAARTWLLNDLFVAPGARGEGVGRALLDAAAAFGREHGAVGLELETTPDNRAAQALYRSAGWQPYTDTLRFQLPLAAAPA
ncbi:GNAT family N-acetyltransferase [Luteimonas sp. RD2P54]|uniref:GNAT family N-acetyltransferase n=1 Tax=Luteimonas endophytica TaxID=3042023 RepID=A0ABT6J6E1_9GAMM|nr:GNAT family N-acetyltransferase [Luteimonas endophytica]MDH5822127.1 GNAT family N-acetyltransferase [Luteimonas endophytica]